MLKNIDLSNKCGSCFHFKPIEDTATGECLQNPYNDTVVHDPKHPHWIVQRSRIKCQLYNAKPPTNADRIRAMSDEELVELFYNGVDAQYCSNDPACTEMLDAPGGVPEDNCRKCLLRWLRQPAEG